MNTFAVTSVNSLLCQASTCFRMGSKFRCIRSTPTEMQSISENDFECFASTGVKSPANVMFEHTNTRYPQVIAKRMLLSWELRRPMLKRHPSISVSRSRTPKAFMPSGEIAYSSWTTPMWRNPRVSTRACTIS